MIRNKTILLLVLCVLMIWTLNVCAEDTPWRRFHKEYNRFVGPVKTVTMEEIEVQVENDIWEETYRWVKRIQLYDPNGYMQEDLVYYRNNSLPGKSIYYHNEDGNLTDSIYYSSDGSYTKHSMMVDDSGQRIRWQTTTNDGTIVPEADWIYDKKGNLIEKIYYDPCEPFSINAKKLYYYDSNNNIAVSILHWYSSLEDDYILGQVKIYEYDADGKLVLVVTTFNKDAGGYLAIGPFKRFLLLDKVVYEYDEYGNIIEVREYDLSDKPVLKTIFKHKYDNEGNLTEKTELSSEGVIQRKETWYRTDEYIRYENEFQDYIQVRVYDSYGNEIEYSFLERSDRTYRIKTITERDYDEQGNVIKAVQSTWRWEDNEFKLVEGGIYIITFMYYED